jgi:RNA polymerase sigma-70 factor (ECF subfamily)
LDVQYRWINGDPSAVLLSGDTPFAVVVLDVDGDAISGIYAVTNPDKLARLEVTP